MSSSPLGRVASEDGEASDSGTEKLNLGMPEREDRRREKRKRKHKHRHDKDRKDSEGDEEERLRRRLIEKKEKGERKTNGSDEEDELFTIQPGADLKRMKEKPRERKDERDMRDNRGDRRDQRFIDRDDRRDMNGRGRGDNGWRDNDRRIDHRGTSYGQSRSYTSGTSSSFNTHSKKHRRSRSRSRSIERKRRDEIRRRDDKGKDDRRDKKDDKDKKEVKEDKNVSVEMDKLEVKEEEKEEERSEEPMEVDDKNIDNNDDSRSTETDRDEMKTPPPNEKTIKYSKFDSSPESNEVPDSPYRSDVDYDEEGDRHEDDHISEEEVEEEVIDLSSIPFEELTDEQKAMMSPDSRKRSENEWQQRLLCKLPVYYPGINGCRSVAEYECINKIEEGTFGIVYRAKDRRTDACVALKRLKMEREKDGFPITSLREVNMLLKASGHENIVNVLEIVVGSSTDKTFLVMEFVEHDMKNLMDTMSKRGNKFKIGEVKTLMRQLLSGMNHLHNLWILHRDLKSSNLLLNHKAVLKIADFGLAREYGNPLKCYTPIVVTLWYRSPELLLGIEKYSTEVDMWSVGCIMAEFILLKPLFTGRSEIEQIKKIFSELGTPSERIWPGYESLRGLKEFTPPHFPYNQLRKKFSSKELGENGFRLLLDLLKYDPQQRISAEDALEKEWFTEDPQPIPREMFPTFPAKSEQGKKPPPSQVSQQPKEELPQVSATHSQLLNQLNVSLDQAARGFTLKF